MKTTKKTTKITTKITMRAITSVLAFAFFAMAASAVYGSGQPPMQDVPGHPFFRQCTRGCLLVRGSSMGFYSWCEEADEITVLLTSEEAARHFQETGNLHPIVEVWNNCKSAPFQAISGGPPRPAIIFPENVPPDSVRVVPTFTPIVQEPPVPPEGGWQAPNAAAGIPLSASIWYGVIRSAIVMPQRELTNAELQIWINEYWELGGKNPFELEVVRIINELRVSYGLNTLEICPRLSMAARYHSHQMGDQGIYQCPRNPARSQGFFAHENPVTGTDVSYRGLMFGIWESVNENLHGGTGAIPSGPVEAWYNSPGHRASMLHPAYTTIGVGAFGRGGTTAKFGGRGNNFRDYVIESHGVDPRPRWREIYNHAPRMITLP